MNAANVRESLELLVADDGLSPVDMLAVITAELAAMGTTAERRAHISALKAKVAQFRQVAVTLLGAEECDCESCSAERSGFPVVYASGVGEA